MFFFGVIFIRDRLVTSIAGLMTWFGICVTYVRFHKGFKVQGFDRATLPYAHSLQHYAAGYAIIACLIICFVSPKSLDYDTLDCDSNCRRLTVLWLERIPERQVGDR